MLILTWFLHLYCLTLLQLWRLLSLLLGALPVFHKPPPDTRPPVVGWISLTWHNLCKIMLFAIPRGMPMHACTNLTTQPTQLGISESEVHVQGRGDGKWHLLVPQSCSKSWSIYFDRDNWRVTSEIVNQADKKGKEVGIRVRDLSQMFSTFRSYRQQWVWQEGWQACLDNLQKGSHFLFPTESGMVMRSTSGL